MLSTMSLASPAWAISAAAVRSHSLMSGFEGVSTCTRRVLSRIARRMLSGSRESMNVNSRPSRASTWLNIRVVPPYVFSSVTTWSPC